MIQKHLLFSLKQAFVGTFAGALISGLVLLPTPARANTTLGVIRSHLSTEWSSIEQQLQASQISYQTLDLNQIQSVDDLNSIQVLFLPNIKVITSEQLRIIQEWVKQGGKLIASGPVGQKSTPLARQLLRSLLGSYWAFPLTTAAQPVSRRDLCQEDLCRDLTQWSPATNIEGQVTGGVLIPSTVESYTAGTWQGSGGSPAVITTQQSTYLGWRWGSAENSTAVDQSWLQAAVGRSGGQSTVVRPIAAQNQNIAPSPTQAPATPTPPTPVPSTVQPLPQFQTLTPSSPDPTPVQPQQRTTPLRSPQRRPIAPQTTRPVAVAPAAPRPIASQLLDPSQQEAPAGLVVNAGNEPITNVMANAMRDELEQLLGRFENALIAANSGNTPINLKVASTELNESIGPRRGANSTIAAQTIATAQQTLKQFPQLVNQQNWAVARQRWLEARQQLWQHYPLQGQRVGAEIRAVWLDRGTIVRSRSERELALVFDRLAQAGINTVFFETLNAGYPIYPSRVAPEQNPLSKGWDPLAAAVKLAHERGMELHAWIWTFATANQRHNTVIGQPTHDLGPVLTAHPNWINKDNQGRNWNPQDKKAYLDPANPEVRNYLLGIVREIAQNYDVDGIQLDYIRYPFQDPNRNFIYGYGTAARQQFKQQTGTDPINVTPRSGALWQQWVNFKVNQVSSFVAEVSQLLKQQHPDIILSVAVFHHPEQERIRKIQQHWEAWARQGYVDWVVPMTYSLDTNRLRRIAEPLTSQQRLGSSLITPSVKVLNIPDIVAIDQIQALRDLSTGGYSIFAFESLRNGLHSFFSQTQGCRGSSCPSAIIPYREPFAAASDRYLALKREWSYLLSQDQLWIREAELEAFRKQSEELEAALQQLAENPDPQTLGKAQRSLVLFRNQFNTAMRLQALEKAYQVRSWDNRLASLDMLLRYGERVKLQR
ncbi:MAG: family 10 glycosylhydrolase [Microcoleaceae cyanobacterium]